MDSQVMTTQVKKGDIFFIENHTLLGRLINWGQRLLSSDNHARYNHSGVFRNHTGLTIESLWRVSSHDFFTRYAGKNVLIARPLAHAIDKNIAVNKILQEDLGESYPVHRFLFLIAPPLAKYINKGKSVCSELTAKYLHYAGVRHKWYQGTTPDKLVDEVRHWKEYEIIFEGIVEQP